MTAENNLLTICIIIPGKLPVPAIMGGAVETLVTYIIDINEEQKKFNFIIISAYGSGVEKSVHLFIGKLKKYLKKLMQIMLLLNMEYLNILDG